MNASNWFGVQNHLLNLRSCVACEFTKVICSKKAGAKCLSLTKAYSYLFRPGGDVNGAAELSTFLSLARQKGYEFRTVDTYLTDNDNTPRF